MTNEVELKLAVSPEIFHLLEKHLQQFNLLKCKNIDLGNTYYDYPDHFLAKQKMGLRIRQENQTFTLTLKTNGKVLGGLHERPEYNLSLEEKETPTNEQLRNLYHFEQLPNAPLNAIFSTDFNRTFWLVEFRDSKIEVAFDQGEIVSGDHSQPICEIEFELKEGKVSDLFYFVEELPVLTDIYFSSASKAKRGYQLSSPVVLTDWLDKWRDFLNKDREESAVDFNAKFHRILKMEQALVEETLSLAPSFFSQDFMKTVERVGAFFNLYHYYDENKTLFEQVLEQRNKDSVEDGILQQLLESNQRFLDDIQALIRFHSETKDNEKTIEKLTALFKTRLYFERMIQLMRLSVSGESSLYH
ncbi:CYTH domain-containing protein [Rodentibacter genomosp. 1]|uniref:CYTH domain-containing protein n=1 Tax=Rodentibacter genomosp. 1 TaxID=1908264 RepID=A0A1V3J7B4_9PAST|nr:inorganic triphosphatase [Rodentibacter genomosp. 1]OOF50989.1 CYTH domain-containing protein [Rodentibacter genomosp. 1]